MQVHVSTDNHIQGRDRLATYVASVVEATLAHFQDRITRVEVHLSDVNGSKPGSADKRCVMEARVEGRKPFAVSHEGGKLDEAISATAGKLRRLIGDSLRRNRES